MESKLGRGLLVPASSLSPLSAHPPRSWPLRHQLFDPPATKSLARPPKQSRFVFEDTAKCRAPEQVFSRLQQLCEIHPGEKGTVLYRLRTFFLPNFSFGLLAAFQNPSGDSFSSEDDGASSSITAHCWNRLPHATIRILRPGLYCSSRLGPLTESPPTRLALRPPHLPHYLPSISPSCRSQARPTSAIDPTVTVTSSSTIAAHSSFTVMHGGQTIHNETADVSLLSTLVVVGLSNID